MLVWGDLMIWCLIQTTRNATYQHLIGPIIWSDHNIRNRIMPQRWFCWGANSHGQLGLGDDVDRLVPTSVSLENIVTICAGGGHTIGLSTLNSYAWGWNEDGQLGFESHQQSVATPNDSLGPFTFAGCGWSHTIAVDSIGDVYVWGDNQFGQIGTEDIGRKPKRKIAVKTRTKKYNEIAHNTAWIKHFEKDCRRSMWLKVCCFLFILQII